MSGNLGGFRSSRAGFADALLTFPGIGLTKWLLLATLGGARDAGGRPE